MATPSWKVSGQYYETCNCDFVCPCVPAQMTVRPSKGSCAFAMAFQIERGDYGSVSLDGLGFIVLGLTPEAMGKGNWSVGLLADERASAEQRDAITAIASGAGRRADGRARAARRQVPRRRISADPLRSQRQEVVGLGDRPSRHGG